jgi:threonine/homoserine/homoserine lactone efflux protein
MGSQDPEELDDVESDAAAFAETMHRADVDQSRRYGRLARIAYATGFAGLALASVLWAFGALRTGDPLFRVLVVAGLVFLVVGALVAKLAEIAATRRTSMPRRESGDRGS